MPGLGCRSFEVNTKKQKTNKRLQAAAMLNRASSLQCLLQQIMIRVK
jgi:hypothetical protein